MSNEFPASSPWHCGELAMQARTGVQEKMAIVGAKVIRSYMPDQHRDFFANLPIIFIAAEDAGGDLWASALVGEPGFIASPDSERLCINAGFNPLDPLYEGIESGDDVGVLGIELQTRRRNRINGKVMVGDRQQLQITVKQSFGNCPKYIQKRVPILRSFDRPVEWRVINIVDKALATLVVSADTFFIASRYLRTGEPSSCGVDISHRGGEVGFVRIDDQRRIIFPDYAGNNFFNTLGNLQQDTSSALLFVDFQRGDLLQLNGTTDIIWASDEKLPFQGVERMLRFTLKKGFLLQGVLPWRWDLVEPSPFNAAYFQSP